jgi:hypothetical protein
MLISLFWIFFKKLLKVLESLFWKLRVVLCAYIDFWEFVGHAFGDGVCHSVDYEYV